MTLGAAASGAGVTPAPIVRPDDAPRVVVVIGVPMARERWRVPWPDAPR